MMRNVFSIGCSVHPSPRPHRSSDAKPEWDTLYKGDENVIQSEPFLRPRNPRRQYFWVRIACVLHLGTRWLACELLVQDDQNISWSMKGRYSSLRWAWFRRLELSAPSRAARGDISSGRRGNVVIHSARVLSSLRVENSVVRGSGTRAAIDRQTDPELLHSVC
jgi:hypothetical protein